eukprot:gene22749-28907_t
MEDNNLDARELRELLLPSDLVIPGEHSISLGELTGVLQTDLLMPVTRGDQELLMRQYGNDRGEIDVKDLLEDAGVWFEEDVYSAETRRRQSQQQQRGGARGGAPHDGFYPRHDDEGNEEDEGEDQDKQQNQKTDRTGRHHRDDDTHHHRDPLLAGSPPRGDGMSLPSGNQSRISDKNNNVSNRYGEEQKHSTPNFANNHNSHNSHRDNNSANRTYDKHHDILHQSMHNIDVLGALHDLVNEETGGDRSRDQPSEDDLLMERLINPSVRKIHSDDEKRPHHRHDDTGHAHRAHDDNHHNTHHKSHSTTAHHSSSEYDELNDLLDEAQDVFDTNLLHSPRNGDEHSRHHNDKRNVKSDNTKPLYGAAAAEAARHQSRHPDSSTDTEVKPAGSLQHLASDRETALEQKVARLESEMAAFDPEFFEQLEDLKFRYSRLQEIVGETPMHSQSPALLSTHHSSAEQTDYLRSVSKGKGSLPLDGLSWSVRNSMTAMDRAGLTSPLVSRPRVVSANSYTPGSEYKSLERGGFEQPSDNRGDDFLYGSATRSSPFSTAGIKGLSLSHDADRRGGGRGGAGGSARHGGTFGLGTGTYDALNLSGSFGGGGIADSESLSNLCERRLAFELTNLKAPEQAVSALIHRVMHASSHPKNAPSVGFVSCAQLGDALSSVGIVSMAPREIEVLATGFASDGKGGINATEFCEMVQTLLYNLIGEHAARVAEGHALVNGQKKEQREEENNEFLMVELCEGILLHDKRAVLGTSSNLFKTLCRPFAETDRDNNGAVPFEAFCDILRDMGSMLTGGENLTLAKKYLIQLSGEEMRENGEYFNGISSDDPVTAFRNTKLSGSLRGAAKVQPHFNNWLSDNTINSKTGNNAQTGGSRNSGVVYEPFCRRMEEILLALLDQQGGVVVGQSAVPWILKEYEFVDTLICQLEAMKPTSRRRALMALQYALSAADPKQECDVDGFTVLNALLSSGFTLQRVNRVRLLRAVEEMGGKIDYRDLCQVLLNSCADWTVEEKNVVRKLLSSMGVTVLERRTWLARLRQSLVETSAKMSRKANISREWLNEDTQNSTSNAPHSIGIPPAAFLHCLRDCDVVLNVEEEATLLDCLDTERLSKLGQREALEVQEGGSRRGSGRDSWSVPLIEYDSFLTFCARHCGSWMDAAPEVDQALKHTLQTISNPILAVHEFASLLHSFDDQSSGSLSERAFQICCHRSRLLANLADEDILRLSDILLVDGGGRVNYTGFVVYLRTLSSALGNEDHHAPTIISQLIKGATDAQNTLLPLRNWLIKHTDVGSNLLTMKDMNALLREFSVMYRPDDLETLSMDIGRHVESSSLNTTSGNKSRSGTKSDYNERTLQHASTGRHTNNNSTFVVDTRALLSLVLKTRQHWTVLHPHLCRKIVKCLKTAGADMHNSTTSTYTTQTVSGPRGIETTVARRILSRLKAFSQTTSLQTHNAHQQDNESESQMIEKDIFAQLCRVTGLQLSIEDVLVLSDATDDYPEASRVRCDVILEALTATNNAQAFARRSDDEDGDTNTAGSASNTSTNTKMTESNMFAINHLRDLVWKTGMRLQRTKAEWIADVTCVVTGFDVHKSGFIAVEDLLTALSLLNATLSTELFLDIPFVPQGAGLVNYRELLKYVLVPPQMRHDDEEQDERYGAHKHSTHSNNTSKHTTKSNPSSPQKNHKHMPPRESAVSMLCNVIRRAIHSFIVSDSSLEEAWVCLLRVFQRFDTKETNRVSPRDFSLAVSVLVGEQDDVVLTKSEWSEIIEHFQVQTQADKNSANTTQYFDSTMVDYMLFCETVLDPQDIKSRQYEAKHRSAPPSHATSSRSAHNATSSTSASQHNTQSSGRHLEDKSKSLDRAKQHLSTSTSSHHTNKERLLSRTTAAATTNAKNSAVSPPTRTTPRSSHTAAHSSRDAQHNNNNNKSSTNADFDGAVSGSKYGHTASRPASSSSSSSTNSNNNPSTYSRSSNHAYQSPRGDDDRGKQPSSARGGGGGGGGVESRVLDRENQAIVRKFEELSQNRQQQQKASTVQLDDRSRGSASALSAAHLKTVDFKSNNQRPSAAATVTPSSAVSSSSLYRVARTQGQASRDVVRGQNRGAANQYSMTGGGGGGNEDRAGSQRDTKLQKKQSDKKQQLGQSEQNLAENNKNMKRRMLPNEQKLPKRLLYLLQMRPNQPKTKAQKEAEAKKAADDERKLKEAAARAAKEEKLKAEQDYIKAQAARGIVVNHTDDLFVPLNNRLADEDDEDYEDHGTGLDAAVDVLHIATKGQSSTDEHPERRRKALYAAYYERELITMKEDYPMLKLSQHKDRIFEAWKKSPENPANQSSQQKA